MCSEPFRSICDYVDEWDACIYDNVEDFRPTFVVKHFTTLRTMPQGPILDECRLSNVAALKRMQDYKLIYTGQKKE